MILRLLIDGIYADLEQKTGLAITAGIADIEEPDSSSSGFTKNVELPFTPRNLRIFGYTNEPYSKEKFNNGLHTTEYIADDITVMRGIAQIEKFTYTTGSNGGIISGSFHVSIIGSAFEWITNARKQMNELQGGMTMIYNMQNVYNNSIHANVRPVRFIPVDRGAFYANGYSDKPRPRRSIHLLDYHPFINVWEAFKLIFKNYIIHSSMQYLFDKLYSAGQIPAMEDEEDIKESCDFSCGGEYDQYSNVFPNAPFDCFNEIDGGDFFANGVLDKYTSGFDWWEQNSYTRYIPPKDVVVRFEMELNFQTPVHGGNSENGIYFIDKLYFGSRPINLGNTYENIVHYKVEDSEEYRDGLVLLSRYKTLSEGLYLTRMSGVDLSKYYSASITYAGREPLNFGIPVYYKNWNIAGVESTLPVANLTLMPYKGAPVEAFDLPGFKIEMVPFEVSRLTFNLKYTTDPIRCTPDNGYMFPCKFVRSWDTSSNRRDVTLGLCSLKPIFGPHIALGDNVSIATVGGDALQIDYLGALRQMFNLMFYTNPLTKEVFIEPRTHFYNLERNRVIDWRGKIDYSKEIEMQELGGDVGNSLKLAYADGNDFVQKHNKQNNVELGSCNISLLNKTTNEAKEIINPMFSPFFLRNVESVGMIVPQNESEKTQDAIDDVEMDVTPIIGYFSGAANRTAGDDKSLYPRYPQLVFQDVAKGINLGFGDINGLTTIPGLRQYYDDNISAYNNGRRITAYIRLAPQDVEAIQTPNDLMTDFRAVYLLSIDGEDLPCLLEGITDYNPASGASTKCQFILDPNLKLTGKVPVVITYNGAVVTRNDAVIIHNSENAD